MRRTLILLGFLLFSTGAFAQTPTIASVVNGASYANAALSNGGIAQGSLFIIFGSNMGPASLAGAPRLPLETSLAGTSIRVTSGGTTVQPYMIYTLAGQVAAVMPSNTPTGAATLTLTYNGASSAPFNVQVVSSSFGIFTLNQGGSGAAVITDGNGVAITSLNSARPGQTLILWGTGLGPVTGNEAGAGIFGDLNVPVDVLIGTSHATIVYKGRASCCVGLDQINFVVPSNQSGCNVAVALKINNIVSNFTTIAISNTATCSDPNGFPPSLLQTLESRGSINIGAVELSKTTTTSSFALPGQPATTVFDSGGGSFFRITRDRFLQTQGFGGSSSVSVGGCYVTQFVGGSGGGSAVLAGYTGLDAGAQLTVNGPTGARTMPKLSQVPGTYGAQLNSQGTTYLGNGTFTVLGDGGADVGAFQVPINGTVVNWQNNNITTVNRSQDLTITWLGGSGSGIVEIFGTSTAALTQNSPSAAFICLAPANAGSFTVPSAVLLALPPSATQSAGGFTFSLGTLSVGGQTLNPFTASGLDFAVGVYSDLTGKSVTYQ